MVYGSTKPVVSTPMEIDPVAQTCDVSPDVKVELTADVEFEALSYETEHKLLFAANLKAPELPEASARAPITVSAVLDRSGSMAGAKLQLVKKTMKFVFQQLKPTDTLGIITYDDNVKEVLPLTLMNAAGKIAAIAAVDAIRDGGSTNLSGGLLQGIKQISEGPRSEISKSTAVLVPGATRPCLASAPTGKLSASFALGNSVIENPAIGTSQKNPFKWTMFLESRNDCPLDQIVTKVDFQLHPSFSPSLVSTNKAPWEVVRTGWGTFEVGVTVHFHPYFKQQPMKLAHTLDFSQERTSTTYTVELNDPVPAPSSSSSSSSSPASSSSSPTTSTSMPSSSTTSSVWLFTDGIANRGIIGQDDMVKAVTRAMAQVTSNCSVFTFGFGEGHVATMLNAISDVANGMYYYIETEEAIPSAFASCLGGLVSVVAQNLKLSITGQNGSIITKVLSQFPSSIDDGGKSCTITVSDIYSEETRNLVLEVSIPALGAAVPAPTPALEFTLSCFNVITCAFDTATCTALIRRPDKTPANQLPNLALDSQRNRLEIAQVLDAAKQLGLNGNVDAGQRLLVDAMAKIRLSPSVALPACQNLLNDLQESVAAMANRYQFQSVGEKKMTCLSGMHSKQRHSGMNTQAYQTSSKFKMQQAFK